MKRRPPPLLLACAALLVAPAAVADSAAKKPPKILNVKKSPDLWATINVCDTLEHPNTIGVHGSMPGLGPPATLWMRFQVHYLAAADGKWHNIPANADSGWRKIGRERRGVLESGQNFEFAPPVGGGAHTLRGAVSFKWVIRGRVRKRLRRLTEAGHRSRTGADPEGFSAAICRIT